MNNMTVKPLGNGRFQINGEDVFAPTLKVARERFAEKHPEYHNDNLALQNENNKKIIQNGITAEKALKQRTPHDVPNRSYYQGTHI